jgi:hypothetical protein
MKITEVLGMPPDEMLALGRKSKTCFKKTKDTAWERDLSSPPVIPEKTEKSKKKE